jgi:hypothetical protein
MFHNPCLRCKNLVWYAEANLTYSILGVSKKTEKLIKPRKLKKLNREKKPIKILKKPTGSILVL